jgi:hypothetical protein
MTPEEIQALTEERLRRWTARLVAEHATPMVLVAVGHDHASGKIVICALEDGPMSEDEAIRALLRYALHHLRDGVC